MTDDQRRLPEPLRSEVDGLRLAANMARLLAVKIRAKEVAGPDGPDALDVLAEAFEKAAAIRALKAEPPAT